MSNGNECGGGFEDVLSLHFDPKNLDAQRKNFAPVTKPY